MLSRISAKGNNVLRDCLIGMTACYVDYFTKERGTTSAKAIMQQQTKKLESILNGTYVPEKAEAEPFASNPDLKSNISLTSLIVDVDAENMKFPSTASPGLVKVCELNRMNIVR